MSKIKDVRNNYQKENTTLRVLQPNLTLKTFNSGPSALRIDGRLDELSCQRFTAHSAFGLVR